ncbi:hypothetical protein QEJ31_14560 [Pigmentibacter sp. JX0631]|uniref:hypothetical protein n=1 Tax=Pigmentibacter sp. JX0631 TaxID=2976982 RepID=UPI0024694303|nr:hypothetical protein [Pigmentibacter sp. JX0631]WGL59752.1 hypothetical protein QEJ31_14560 [Pigmentibacter sp. JX0631]
MVIKTKFYILIVVILSYIFIKCDRNPFGDYNNSMSDQNFHPGVTTESPSSNVALIYKAFILGRSTNTIYVCSVSNNSLSNCFNTGANNINAPTGIVVYNGVAFIANLNLTTITSCNVNSDFTFSNCIDSGAATINHPYELTLVGSSIYVANSGQGTGSTVSLCSISNNSLNCSTVGNGFNCPTEVNFLGNYVFVSNCNGGSILICNASNFLGCNSFAVAGSIIGVTITNGYTYSTGSGFINYCSITSSIPPTLTSCNSINSNYSDGPVSFLSGNIFYTTNGNPGRVNVCNILANGSPSNCQDSGASGLPTGLNGIKIIGF